ncbi:type II secretion system protein N [Fretibacter rubidus]|uniref:type II secretion system protein N n=1 Tax=Fretibacter rubidus TaxID=570162 RepID=UPI00352B351C
MVKCERWGKGGLSDKPLVTMAFKAVTFISGLQKALTLALGVVLVFFLTKAVMTYIAPVSVWVTPVTSKAPISTQSRQAAKDFSLSFDPFHRTAAVQTPRGDIGGDAPETTLNLTLVGRRAGDNGTAILVTPDRKQAVYSVGDEIINGVTLKAVNPDFIVLSLDGRLERLTFNQDAKTGLLSAPVNVPNTNLTPAMLLDSIRLNRVDRDNRLVGFRVSSKTDAVKLSQFGLQDGDIITRIGDEDLTLGRPEISYIARDLAKVRSVKLSILRGDKPVTVTVGTS